MKVFRLLKRTPRKSSQSGQVLVILVAFLMTGLMLAGFVIAVAIWLSAQQQLDGAAEQAALAAAETIDTDQYRQTGKIVLDCGTGQASYNAAQNILTSNIPQASLDSVVCPGDQSVTVYAHWTVQQPFAGIIGPSTLQLSTVQIAKASVNSAGS